jgi:DNA-binding LytR/AlgR family response regulator
MEQKRNLEGLQILIVEDEYLLAEEMAELVRELGAQVVGPFGNIATVLELLLQGKQPDIAVLDIDLQGRAVYPIAEALIARMIPFLFVTGFGGSAIPPKYQNATRIQKPYSAEILRTELLALAAG